MKRRLKKSKSFSKVWMFIIGILILISIGLFFVIHSYFEILQMKEGQFDHSRSYILSNKILDEITSVEAFHELKSYHIFFGKDPDGEGALVFFPLEKEEHEPIVVSEEDILAKEKLYEENFKQCSSCRSISVKPAMINKHPLWEFTYYDEHDRYNLDYFSMIDGTRYERLQLKQTFK